MERQESFAAAGLKGLKVRMQWASVVLTCSNVETFEVEITGTDCDQDISSITLKAEAGTLSVMQPVTFSGLTGAHKKLQVRIFVPTFWKGAIDTRTVTGSMEAMGLRGTDVSLATVTGALDAASMEAICLTGKSVTGQIHMADTACESLKLRNVSGNITADACDFRTAHCCSISGDCTLQATGTFDSVSASGLTGHMMLYIPFAKADALLRAASGRLRTDGVNLVGDAPLVRMHTVSGNLIINNNSNQENDYI